MYKSAIAAVSGRRVRDRSAPMSLPLFFRAGSLRCEAARAMLEMMA